MRLTVTALQKTRESTVLSEFEHQQWLVYRIGDRGFISARGNRFMSSAKCLYRLGVPSHLSSAHRGHFPPKQIAQGMKLTSRTVYLAQPRLDFLLLYRIASMCVYKCDRKTAICSMLESTLGFHRKFRYFWHNSAFLPEARDFFLNSPLKFQSHL